MAETVISAITRNGRRLLDMPTQQSPSCPGCIAYLAFLVQHATAGKTAECRSLFRNDSSCIACVP